MSLTPRLVIVSMAILPAHAEAQDWRPVSSGRSSLNADSNFAAWDPVRERLVLFDSTRTTWEWDGRRWWQRPAGPEMPWGEAALAWDPVSQRVLAFGGLIMTSGVGPSNETWAYDGVCWTELQPSQRPPARYRHAMATDAGRGRIVLFGGHNLGSGVPSATWEWTGTDWVMVAPSGSGPPQLDGARMAYDPLRQRCVLFGGSLSQSGPGTYTSQTWEWDGRQWQRLSVLGPPGGREGHGLAFDTRRGRVLLHGGFRMSNILGVEFPPLSDTWEWDGATWQSLGSGPAAVGSMAEAPGLAAMILATSWDATWSYDGATWTRPERAPTTSSEPAIAYDPVRRRAVTHVPDWIWKSFALTPPLLETWEHDGFGWRRASATSPVGSVPDPTLAHDASRPGVGEVILFADGSTYLWNGAAWILSPATGPTGNGVMAADTARGEVVLYTNAGQTWIWRSGGWTQRPVSGPPPRSDSAMVFDPQRGMVVLFGGYASGSGLDDTWTWDGAVWSPVQVASSPPPRYDHGMAFDSIAGEIVVCGGRRGRLGFLATGTWAFDGSSWAQRTTSAEPFGQIAMTEVAPGRIVALSSDAGVWEYDALPSATKSRFGTGCGAVPLPDLDAFGLPRLGGQEFALDVARMRPTAPAAVLLAAGPATVSLGSGCSLYVDPTSTVSVPVTTGPTGAVSLPLPIPETIPAGTTLYGQAASLEPGAPLGLALTQRVTFSVGR